MRRLFPLGAVAAISLSSAAQAATVEITVGNIRNGDGHVRVALCTAATFLKETCAYNAAVPAQKGTVRLRLENVPPGVYAAQGYHDEKDWGEVRLNILGMPRNGIGFSRDAPIRLGPPKWDDARFDVGPNGAASFMTMKYF